MLDRVQNAALTDVRTTVAETVPTELPNTTLSPDIIRPISVALGGPDREAWVLGDEPGGWVSSGAAFSWIRIPPKLITAVRGKAAATRPGGRYMVGRPIAGQHLVFQRITSRGVP